MSATEPRNQVSTWLQYLRDNGAGFLALVRRKPKPAVRRVCGSPLHLAVSATAVIGAILATMIVVDAWSISVAQRAPQWLVARFDQVTDFGNSGWMLTPIALVLAMMAAVASVLPPMSQRVLAAAAVRLGFLFSAIALPGLLLAILKRLIGRARPLVAGSADPFLYLPLGWNVEYASLPSGHAINAFAAAMALGALWPKTRPFLWTYAVTIAVSRVVLTAHFPSDVLAGAVIGIAGAFLVREWFAARRLAFVAGADGAIRPLPGPSFARIKKVARQLIAP